MVDPAGLRKQWEDRCDRSELSAEREGNWRHSQIHTCIQQGWKLHLSATILAANGLLDASLDLLDAERVPYKVARSLDVVFRLNAGVTSPYSQIGKIVTVYAGDNAQSAKKLGESLATILAGTSHPSVPYDRQLTASAPVYYRYGSYVKDELFGPSGPEPDVRTYGCAVPDWIRDDLRSDEDVPQSALRNTPYRLVRLLSLRGKGYTAEVIDTTRGELLILKHGKVWGEEDFSGEDGCSRQGRESRILKRLFRAGCNVPQIVNEFDHVGGVFTLMRELPGVSLASLLAAKDYQMLSVADRIRLCVSVVDLVESVHKAGVVWGDIKPANIVVDGTSSARIRAGGLDFEGSSAEDSYCEVPWVSPGYASPEVTGRDLARTTRESDYYALGVTLKQVLLGQPVPSQEKVFADSLLEFVPRSLCSNVECLLDHNSESRVRGFEELVDYCS